MNTLRHESSPYLLQHAENPVHWQPWGQAALQEAQKTDKPILVSIGYSTCHWCHVMERESFEDPQVAAFMNAHFVNIKVDREERPDIDHIYMQAVQLISGSGGWPLNCFLTPEGLPFFGGTYYPPQAKYKRPSWMQILEFVHDSFAKKRAAVESQAQRLTQMIQNKAWEVQPSTTTPDADFLEKAWQNMLPQFDEEYGGFGQAPKFPSSMTLSFLLMVYQYRQQQRALEHVRISLEKMVLGGIFDQLGGGFSRYTVDRAWKIPHFEKMLYDNALLTGLLAETWKLDGRGMWKRAAAATIAFIEREMTHDEGGFYTALDADSEGEEGKYYVWQAQEIDQVLGEDAHWFKRAYQVTDTGNWEGSNILHRQWKDEDWANQLPHISEQQHLSAMQQLLQVRKRRVPPGLDYKILLSDNALMIIGLVKAWQAWQYETHRTMAERAVQFIQAHFENDQGELYHTFAKGAAKHPAFIDDYAYWIRALLEIYTLRWDTQWLIVARQWCEHVNAHFWDDQRQMYRYGHGQLTDAIVHTHQIYDNATPSGNAMMAGNLLRLAYYFDDDSYRHQAASMFSQMEAVMQAHPMYFGQWACEYTAFLEGFKEITIMGPEYEKAARILLQGGERNMLLLAAECPDERIPAFHGRTSDGNSLQLYLCKGYTCQQPVQTISALKELL